MLLDNVAHRDFLVAAREELLAFGTVVFGGRDAAHCSGWCVDIEVLFDRKGRGAVGGISRENGGGQGTSRLRAFYLVKNRGDEYGLGRKGANLVWGVKR